MSFCRCGQEVSGGAGFVSVSREGDVVVVDATDYAGCCSIAVTVDLRDVARASARVDGGASDVRVRGPGTLFALGESSSGSSAAGLLLVPALGCAVVWLTRGPWRAVAEIGREEVGQVASFLRWSPVALAATTGGSRSPMDAGALGGPQ